MTRTGFESQRRRTVGRIYNRYKTLHMCGLFHHYILYRNIYRHIVLPLPRYIRDHVIMTFHVVVKQMNSFF